MAAGYGNILSSLLKTRKEIFDKRQRLIDTCRAACMSDDLSAVHSVRRTKMAEVLRALQTEFDDDRTYYDCLEVAIVCNSAPCVKVIVEIHDSPDELPWEIFTKVRSKEIATLLLKHKGCNIVTLNHLAWEVLKGKYAEMNRELLIELMIKTCALSPAIVEINRLFMSMVSLGSIDGIKRMIETSPFTRGWRDVANSNGNYATVDGAGTVSSIFKYVLQRAATLEDKRMFEELYSMVRPYSVFCYSLFFNFGRMVDLNPWVLVKYLDANWYGADDYGSQIDVLLDPKQRERSEQFLFRLTTVLFLQHHLPATIVAAAPYAATVPYGEERETYGTRAATELLTGNIPEWMSNVKKQHDEVIEVLLTELPMDLVVLSLTYLVGQ